MTFTQKDLEKIVDSYFLTHNVSDHHIESYNYFVSSVLPHLVKRLAPIVIERQHKVGKDLRNMKYTLTFENVYFGGCNSDSVSTSDRVIPIFPDEVRKRHLSYECPVYILIRFEVRIRDPNKNGGTETVNEEMHHVKIGKLPVMVKSLFCNLKTISERELFLKNECPDDSGGFFIMNGIERVYVLQERWATNTFHISYKNGLYETEVRCVRAFCSKPSSILYVRYDKTRFHITLMPCLKSELPFFLVVSALGLPIESAVVAILGDQMSKNYIQTLGATIDDYWACISPSEKSTEADEEPNKNDPFLCIYERCNIAKTRLSKVDDNQSAKHQRVDDILSNELLHFFPNFTPIQKTNNLRKAYYLCYIVKRMLWCIHGEIDVDDRDHFAHKRLDTVNDFFSDVIASCLSCVHLNYTKILSGACEKGVERPNIAHGTPVDSILRLSKSIAKGNWNMGKGKHASRNGVTLPLSSYNYTSRLSCIHGIVSTPIGREGKLTGPRLLHGTHWGMVCPVETPEGQACGLIKRLAIMSRISNTYSPYSVISFCVKHEDFLLLDNMIPQNIHQGYKVFVNGAWIGNVKEGKDSQFVYFLRNKRRNGILSFETSIAHDSSLKEVRIHTDSGRILRPLLVVKEESNELALNHDMLRGLIERTITFDKLVESGVIEYLDTDEEEQTLIAISVDKLKDDEYGKATHCEIDPSTILGVSASSNPFPDHNQGPRNTYQASMGKQAVGIPISSFLNRMESLSHFLWYPQKPLVINRNSVYFGESKYPCGQNLIVAIIPYDNQEDAIIMSQRLVDFGGCRSSVYVTHTLTEKPQTTENVVSIERPQPPSCFPRYKNTHIDEHGLPSIGRMLKGGDVVIGRTTISKDTLVEGAATTNTPGYTPRGSTSNMTGGSYFSFNDNMKATSKDISEVLKRNEDGFVDKAMLTVSQEGYKMAKVRIRSTRFPSQGDKFTSRHGQKGTIATTKRPEDLPFTKEGITPDIIINPNAIPSRMTLGQMLESVFSKLCCMAGDQGDGTPFREHHTVESIESALQQYGFSPSGKEVMYSGETGRRLQARIFIGPVYYKKLKHISADKVHARGRGPVQILTRQPTEGKSNDGGLRCGEMEKDCLVSYGAVSTLRERLFECSDPYRIHVCKKCGMMAKADTRQHVYFCTSCTPNEEIVQLQIPYAFKLLMQELMSMNILPKLIVDK